jgi:hypothetical protein
VAQLGVLPAQLQPGTTIGLPGGKNNGPVTKAAATGAVTSRRLEKTITELRAIQKLLRSGEGLDDRILTDFRDAVNRVRNTAWSAQQYAALKATEQDPTNLLSVLAGERIRAAFQLVRVIQSDLTNKDVKFQARQLIQLQEALNALADRLNKAVAERE